MIKFSNPRVHHTQCVWDKAATQDPLQVVLGEKSSCIDNPTNNLRDTVHSLVYAGAITDAEGLER